MAKPKLALIPAAQGSKLFSVLPSSGVGDFDFTRSGSATRINSQGLIETVANGQSRLNYPLIDGKVVGCPHHLLEPERLQLIQYSEDFSQGYWQKDEITVLANQTISPDGSLNADEIIESTTSNVYHRVLPAAPISGTGGTKYSCSVYVKKKEETRHIYWVIQKGVDAFYMHIDMTNYVISDSNSSGSANLIDSSITPVGNDWYRISISGIVSSANGNYYNQIYLNKQLGSGFNPSQYTGDGTSGLYLWGWQLEVGSYPTSYIKSNSGSTTTRQVETANGAGDAATFSDSEGVFMAEISALADDLVAEGVSISDETINNRVVIFKWTTSNSIKVRVASGGTNYFDKTVSVSDITAINKIAIKYKVNDFSVWINGLELETDTSGITPIGLSKLNFNGATSPSAFYGNTKQIQYYNSALTDSELEQLTSWTSFSDMANGQLYTIE